jgi:DNA-binding YbaB/EbfC family protein
MKNMKNLNKLVKQAQKMKSEIDKIQARLAEQTVEASSGGGMVTAVVNGRQELVSIKFEPDVVDPEEVEMLEDLVVAAVNEAGRKVQDMMQEEMAKVTGMDISNLPF